LKKHAEDSQRRIYPDDFVMAYVDSSGKDFDLGFDYVECAHMKFYRKYGAEKYVRYLCLCDYPLFQGYGIGFSRTQTIANGAASCDFRMRREGQTLDGWPPENVPEFKSDPR